MNIQKLNSLRSLFVGLSIIFTIIVLAGCPIRLIAPYDAKIDQGVTELQKKTAAFFTKIERQGGSKPEDYKNYITFYDDAKVALSGLIVRAKAAAKNKLTEGQLKILRQQFQKLEADHQKMGIPQAAVPHLERAFNRTFTAILKLERGKPKSE